MLVEHVIFRPAFEGSRRTLFIIHGYTQSWEAEWLHDIKNEVLDVRIVVVSIYIYSSGKQ